MKERYAYPYYDVDNYSENLILELFCCYKTEWRIVTVLHSKQALLLNPDFTAGVLLSSGYDLSRGMNIKTNVRMYRLGTLKGLTKMHQNSTIN
jgi:hypothetical protein